MEGCNTPGDSIPTDDCILANAKNLAKYAKKCQQAISFLL